MAYQSNNLASSTGQPFTAGYWLDAHFEASRPEYEAQLRAVGIQPGWRVLDAACGSGSFLPWLADLVGPSGHLTALDLAPDNVASVERRLTEWVLCCSVRADVGTVLALPYPNDSFDAVWFANTSQYLNDEELMQVLQEFQRVVRPGGLVALKEVDASLLRIHPAPIGLVFQFFQARAHAGYRIAIGTLRAPTLPGELRKAGLDNVWHRTTLIERSAPLNPAARAMWRGAITSWATHAADLELPAESRDFWVRLRDPDLLEQFFDDPDCNLIDANILTVGTVQR